MHEQGERVCTMDERVSHFGMPRYATIVRVLEATAEVQVRCVKVKANGCGCPLSGSPGRSSVPHVDPNQRGCLFQIWHHALCRKRTSNGASRRSQPA